MRNLSVTHSEPKQFNALKPIKFTSILTQIVVNRNPLSIHRFIPKRSRIERFIPINSHIVSIDLPSQIYPVQIIRKK